jgi:hypothetical protein
MILPRSDRNHDKQRIAAFHRSFVAPQDYRAGSARVDRRGVGVGANNSNFLSGRDGFGQGYRGLKLARMRSRVMDLQVRFLGIAGEVKGLRDQRRNGFSDTTDLAEQIMQTPIEGSEVAGSHVSSSAALRVDRRDLMLVSGTQRAAGKIGPRPAPEGVEARGHGALGGINRITASGDVADPRMQFQSVSSTVEINVVGGVLEQLGFEKVGESRGGRTIVRAGKGSGEIFTVGRMTPLTRGMGRFVEHGNENYGAVQLGRVPSIDPLAQQGRPLVFVTMSGAVDEQHGTGAAAPDPSIASESCVAKTVALLSRGQRRPIQRRRARRNFCHD